MMIPMAPLFTLLLALFQMMTSDDLDHLVAPPAEARITYGDDALQFGELRLPERGRHGRGARSRL